MASNRVEVSAPKALSSEDESRLENTIRNALGLDVATDTPVYPARLEESARRELLRAEIEKLSRSDRRALWTLRVRKGKDELGVIEPYLLNRKEREIRRSHAALRDFDGTMLPGESAGLFADLYDAATGIRPYFRQIWEDESAFVESFFRSITHTKPALRDELSHFMSQQEMQEIYLRERNRQHVHQLTIARIDSYIAQLDYTRFERIEHAALPLYYLGPLLHFPFDEFLHCYGIAESPRGKKGVSRLVLSEGIDYLERLFHALYLARRLPEDNPATGDLLQVFGFSPDEAERLAMSMTWLADTARDFSRTIPLADIIRVARRDPFYRLQVYVPKPKLAEFYRAKLKLTCLRTLDERFPNVRVGVVGYYLRELFNEELEALKFYEAPDAHGENLDDQEEESTEALPRPKYGLAMRCLITYLHGHYRSVLQEEARIIGRILPARMREEQGTLMHQAGAFEDVVERLIAIDHAMAPQEYDGQTLARLRRNIDRDISQQKAYRAFIAQKQREAFTLIDKALEHLTGMREVFEEVIPLHSQRLDESYRSMRGTKRSREGLKEAVEREIRIMDQMEALVTETIMLDDGR